MFPTEVVVDYDVLKCNFQALQKLDPECSLAPVIKSDGYGHGLVETARAFLSGGAERMAVFRVEEALKLRENGVDCPVWILLGALPFECASSVGKGFTFGCYDLWQAEALSAAAVLAGTVEKIHLAVDTGMGRLGELPSHAGEMISELEKMPGLQLCGVYTHSAKADEPDHPVTRRQVEAFRSLLKILPSGCVENHFSASVAWLNGLLPELKYARPGICLYAPVTPKGADAPITRGAMTLKTKLVSLKELPAGHTISYNCVRKLERNSRVGVAPLGYEDGYMRRLTDCGQALVAGHRVPVLGTVCMSMVMLDLTDVPEAAVGSEAVFLGRQGSDEITIWELSRLACTVPHEILCSMGKNK